jgi:hypothetical protein
MLSIGGSLTREGAYSTTPPPLVCVEGPPALAVMPQEQTKAGSRGQRSRIESDFSRWDARNSGGRPQAHSLQSKLRRVIGPASPRTSATGDRQATPEQAPRIRLTRTLSLPGWTDSAARPATDRHAPRVQSEPRTVLATVSARASRARTCDQPATVRSVRPPSLDLGTFKL